MIVNKSPLSLYFGDAADNLLPVQYQNLPNTPLLELRPFVNLQKAMSIESLHFLRQVHGVEGVVIRHSAQSPTPFSTQGDFLVTNSRNIGLGVVTADCLPVVMFDPITHVVGIAHAGWRGSVQRIVAVMLATMEQEYGTRIDTVQVFFGPSAKQCCYLVDETFKHNFADISYADSVFERRPDGVYFDLPGFNRAQLESLGVQKEAISQDYNICTICNARYCSYRVQKELACRQMTVVSVA